MNGFLEVVVERELFDDWDQYAATVREAVSVTAAQAGLRLLAGDPEFIVTDVAGEVRVRYRMVK